MKTSALEVAEGLCVCVGVGVYVVYLHVDFKDMHMYVQELCTYVCTDMNARGWCRVSAMIAL